MKKYVFVTFAMIKILLLSVDGIIAQTYNNGSRKSRDRSSTYKPPQGQPGVSVLGSPLQPVDPPTSGCQAIYNHLANWKGESNESPAAEVCFSWYVAPPDDNGIGVIVDPFFPRGPIVSSVPFKANKDAVNSDSKNIRLENLLILQDSSGVNGLGSRLKKARFEVNTEQNGAEIFDVKGKTVTNIAFYEPNKKGEIWGRCSYQNKSYYVKMTWEKGKMVNEYNFELLK
ncbi:MAG: hypothetical protein IPO92_23750 [Saprospiraceae bacterium]|nr:hypothetical protein [Saprospiraceae bacterium]